MNRDKPKGEELRAVRGFERIAKRIRFLQSEQLSIAVPSAVDFLISVGHAREGVRTNGWQRLTTIIDSVDYLDQFQRDVARGSERFEKVLIELADLQVQAQELMAKFRRCPACKAKDKGIREGNSWADCEKCNGRGMIPRKPTTK